MTDSQNKKLPDPVDLGHAVAAVAERSQQMVRDFLARQAAAPASAPAVASLDPMNVGGAFIEMTARLMADPAPLLQAQVSLWNDYMRLWQRTTERFLGVESDPPVIQPAPGDRRFKDPAWNENALFDFIKQSYLLSARFLQGTVREVEGLDDKAARKLDFYTRQFVDALAPSNFVLTNPEVLRTTVETGGENLLHGLQHLLEDLDAGKGQLRIKMTDHTQFRLGETIATAPGKVIFQNALMQVIQYAPTTATVRRRPLLIVPPWINKFYILDLRESNSFVRWAVAQGHSVFMISWVNPDPSLADKQFEDYVREGLLTAVDAVAEATGERRVNAIGYCIGGTLLATTLAYLAAKSDDRIVSATYFVTLVDFTESGELGVFIDEEQLRAIEAKMAEEGVLHGQSLFDTFNMLRANDLIWSFVVNNYLLGKEPFPFDLLYWNSDSTAMPRAMHSYYLRNMYQANRLIVPGGIEVAGVPIDLARVKTPSFVLGAKEDHIVPWRSAYMSATHYGGPTKFCLAMGGHIAGVINPPGAGKYGYWLNKRNPESADEWFDTATKSDGSWWPEWDKWVGKFGGGTVAARVPGEGPLPAIEDAPGSYVRKRDG